jgi:GNAT superfamily N-acetyltransferase
MESHHIITLADSDRWRLRAHLKSLSAEDRRLRFGATLNDAAVDRYVDLIDFDTDAVLAVATPEGAPLAVAHVAPVGEGAELGLSVLDGQRQRGMGGALFERASAWARARGLHRVFMHCLRENRVILALARRHGMRLEFEGAESTAVLALPAGMLAVATPWPGLARSAARRSPAMWAFPFGPC